MSETRHGPSPLQQRRHRRNANEPGHAHELTFSCYRRFPFFSRERACRWLAESIEKARKSLEFDVWAWVFMPDHIHLIVHPRHPTYDMACIRRQIKEPVARKALAWIREQAPHWLPKLARQRGARTEHLFWQSGGGRVAGASLDADHPLAIHAERVGAEAEAATRPGERCRGSRPA